MESLTAILQGVVEHPTALLLTLTLIALGYLYREREADQKEYLDMVLKQEAAHRDTLAKIIPIAEKLIDSVEVLERVTTATIGRDK